MADTRVLQNGTDVRVLQNGTDVRVTETAASHYTLTVDTASFGITPNAVGLKVDNRIPLTTASFVTTPAAVGLSAGRKVSLTTSSYALTPTAVGLRVDNRVALTAASFGLTPLTVGLRVANYILAEPPLTPPSNITATTVNSTTITLDWESPLGFEITTRPIGLAKGYPLSVTSSSFAITTNNVRLFKMPAALHVSPPLAKPVNLVAEAMGDDGAYLTWDPGPAFAWTTNEVNFSQTIVVPVDVPPGVPTGITATPIPGGVRLEWTGVEPFINLQPRTVNLVLGGVTLPVDASSYALTPQDVALRVAHRLAVDPASFTITPVSIGLLQSLQLPVTPASYTLTPVDVGLVLGGIILASESGAFLITPNDINFLRTRVMMLTPAAYTWTGQNIELIWDDGSVATYPPLAYPLGIRLLSGESFIRLASGETTARLESGEAYIILEN